MGGRHRIFCIHSSNDGFYLLVAVNNAAMNLGRQISILLLIIQKYRLFKTHFYHEIVILLPIWDPNRSQNKGEKI